MAGDPAESVERLIDALHDAPSRLPLAEITAIHNTGHDVRVTNTTDRVVATITRRRDGRLTGLTPREHQVATVVAAGYTNRQIAVALDISVATVKDHVHSILTKSGVENRSQLIAAWYGGLEPRPIGPPDSA